MEKGKDMRREQEYSEDELECQKIYEEIDNIIELRGVKAPKSLKKKVYEKIEEHIYSDLYVK